MSNAFCLSSSRNKKIQNLKRYYQNNNELYLPQGTFGMSLSQIFKTHWVKLRVLLKENCKCFNWELCRDVVIEANIDYWSKIIIVCLKHFLFCNNGEAVNHQNDKSSKQHLIETTWSVTTHQKNHIGLMSCTILSVATQI